MLRSLLKAIFDPNNRASHPLLEPPAPMPRRAERKSVLNVGSSSKDIPIPTAYTGWNHVLLDIDPVSAPDIVCDARKLIELPPSEYDSVYCSHNLEHYYAHDARRVLAGFHHVLRDDGFTLIRVPDMGALMQRVVQDQLDIDDVLYQSPAGPITVKDVIYGFGSQIEHSGVDFFAHKTGFTRRSLTVHLKNAGFPFVYTSVGSLEVVALGFKRTPSTEVAASFGMQPEDAEACRDD